MKREYLQLEVGKSVMEKRNKRKKWLLFLSVIGVFGIIAVGLGALRYGGVSGLTRRAQLAVRSYLPEPTRPSAAPTLQPEATVDVALFVQALATVPPATNTPIPTLPATWTAVPDEDVPLVPSETPQPSATPTATATPIYQLAESSVYIDTYTHHWQDWNNCGPATMTTYLSALGATGTQDDAAAVLKPNPDDKNVNPSELITYAQQRGFVARYLVNGSAERLKLLLSNGMPVMIETWLEPEPNDGFGHYRLVVGYDDAAQEWIVSDSYISKDIELPYQGIRISYSDMEALWEVFANTYIVVYPTADAPLIEAIIGDDLSEEKMWQNGLAQYQQDVQLEPENSFAWHNLGSALVAVGEMEQAAVAFDQARTLGLPWRMFWYQFGVYEAYTAVGRYEDVVGIANATNDSGGGGEEVYYWKGVGLSELGDDAGAAQAWRYALWWHEGYEPAVGALQN